MTTIGIPGSPRGIQKSDPTIAEVLKSTGYATAQFGKNHLGDNVPSEHTVEVVPHMKLVVMVYPAIVGSVTVQGVTAVLIAPVWYCA